MCNRGQNTLLRLATSRPNEFRGKRSEDLRPRSGRASEEASNERRLVLHDEGIQFESLQAPRNPVLRTPVYNGQLIYLP